jgi:hypothetical protein
MSWWVLLGPGIVELWSCGVVMRANIQQPEQELQQFARTTGLCLSLAGWAAAAGGPGTTFFPSAAAAAADGRWAGRAWQLLGSPALSQCHVEAAVLLLSLCALLVTLPLPLLLLLLLLLLRWYYYCCCCFCCFCCCLLLLSAAAVCFVSCTVSLCSICM